VKSLFVPFHVDNVATQVSIVAAHFAMWPSEQPIVTDAKGALLASVLLLASLHNHSLHITDVQNKEDLMLIKLSKSKQLKVTCDVAIYALFFTRERYNGAVKALPTREDQTVKCKNLDVFYAFSVVRLRCYGYDRSGLHIAEHAAWDKARAGRETIHSICHMLLRFEGRYAQRYRGYWQRG